MIYFYQGGNYHGDDRQEDHIASPDLAREVEEMVQEDGNPVGAEIQDTLRFAKRERLRLLSAAASLEAQSERERGGGPPN